VTGYFAEDSSVATAYHKHGFGGRVGEKGDVGYHLLVCEFVHLGNLDNPVEYKHDPVVEGTKKQYVLVLRTTVVEDLNHLERGGEEAKSMGVRFSIIKKVRDSLRSTSIIISP